MFPSQQDVSLIAFRGVKHRDDILEADDVG